MASLFTAPSVYSNLLWRMYETGVHGKLQFFQACNFFLKKQLDAFFFFLRAVYSMREQNGTSREGKIGRLARSPSQPFNNRKVFLYALHSNRMLFVLGFLNLSSSLHFYSPLIQLTCVDSPHVRESRFWNLHPFYLVQSGIRENISCRS